MDILNIRINKNRQLTVKNSPECTCFDLLALAVGLVTEISHQTGKSHNKVLKDIKRNIKKQG